MTIRYDSPGTMQGMGYSMMPYKLKFCKTRAFSCDETPKIMLDGLPPNPTPGRVPKGCDHLHVEVRLSGDRAAMDIGRWRGLLVSTMNCKHGLEHGRRCTRCGKIVDREGKRIGTRKDGTPVVTPNYQDRFELEAWVPSQPSRRNDSRYDNS